MKTRLALNFGNYFMRLLSLLERTYFSGAHLVLNCLNTDDEYRPGYSTFSLFQAKSHL